MAVVNIPALLRDLSGGKPSVEAEGETVGQVLDNLEKACPGIRERLIEEGRLRSNVSVAVDGEISRLGLRERVAVSSEIHFVMAIKGGR